MEDRRWLRVIIKNNNILKEIYSSLGEKWENMNMDWGKRISFSVDKKLVSVWPMANLISKNNRLGCLPGISVRIY